LRLQLPIGKLESYRYPAQESCCLPSSGHLKKKSLFLKSGAFHVCHARAAGASEMVDSARRCDCSGLQYLSAGEVAQAFMASSLPDIDRGQCHLIWIHVWHWTADQPPARSLG
jgi:hypothetical protein